MRWNSQAVKYRLHYWAELHGYVIGGNHELIPIIKKRTRRTTDPRFVSDALDNHFFDSAFDILTDQEQQFLIALYMDGSEDLSHLDQYKVWQTIIKYTDEALKGLSNKVGLTKGVVKDIAWEAVGKMVFWLNEHEIAQKEEGLTP